MQKVLDSDGNRVELATIGLNGRLRYGKAQEETQSERSNRERFWRSLGKKIRKGSFIKS